MTSPLNKDELLSTVRGLARSTGGEARNPKWTSRGALELDIFCPSKADFELILAVLAPVAKLDFVRDLSETPHHRTQDALFSEARALFNEERYWECHEVLEGAWKIQKGDEKRLLQGIILVCAAFVHHQKNEDEVALGVLARASKQLYFPGPSYGGFDLAALRANVQKIRERGRFLPFRV
jgi:uncharacterized protein